MTAFGTALMPLNLPCGRGAERLVSGTWMHDSFGAVDKKLVPAQVAHEHGFLNAGGDLVGAERWLLHQGGGKPFDTVPDVGPT